MTKFSIVVPAYNAEATLPETLDAILAQGLDDWECVVVDDGSADATAAVAERYAALDVRVRALSQPNQGTGGAYNTGVTAALGEFIVLCSSDDILLPAHLATMLALTDRAPRHGIYSCNGDFLDPSGARRPFYEGSEWRVERSLTFQDVLERCFFGVGATYRREVFDLVGGYRQGIYGEDYDFWLRVMARGVTHRYTPEVLALHRVGESQKSADLRKVLESDIATFRNLIDAAWVQPAQMPAVERAIAAKQAVLDELIVQSRRDELLPKIRRALSRVVGRHAAAGLIDAGLAVRRRVRALTKGRRP